MKLGKAIAAAVGTAAAVGAAVYAKRKLDEAQTPLKKQKNTAWKSGEEVSRSEFIRKPVSENRQTDILKSRIDTATRRYEDLSERDNSEPEIKPVNFTFISSDEDNSQGVSFDCVFDHFNRLEKPDEKVSCDAPQDTEEAPEAQEIKQDGNTEQSLEDKREFTDEVSHFANTVHENGVMAAVPVAAAVVENSADLPSAVSESEPIDESIFDLSVTEPEEQAVNEATETAENEAAQTVEQIENEVVEIAEQSENEVAEATEQAVSEEVAEAEDTAEGEQSLAEQFGAVMAEESAVATEEQTENEIAQVVEQIENETVEAAELAVSEEVAEAEDTAEGEQSLAEQFGAVMAEESAVATEEQTENEIAQVVEQIENETVEAAELAVSEEVAEAEDTAEGEQSLAEQFGAVMAEESAVATEEQTENEIAQVVEQIENETVEAAEQAVSEEVAEAEDTAESEQSLAEQFGAVMAEESTVVAEVQAENEIAQAAEQIENEAAEAAELAVSEEVAEAEDKTEGEQSLAEQFGAVMAEESAVVAEEQAVNEATETAENEVAEAAEQAVSEEVAEAEDTAENEQSLAEQFGVVMAEESAVVAEEQDENEAAQAAEQIENEVAEAAEQSENEVAEAAEQAVSEEVAETEDKAEGEQSLAEQFGAVMAEESAVVAEEQAVNEATETAENEVAEAAEQIENETVAMVEQAQITNEADDELDSEFSDEILLRSAEEKPRTMDFFDLPDEAYKPVQITEEKHDDNVAEVEDLFGDLLMEDEPKEKKTFNDPSEVFSMFDTADAGQDDFDKYHDEKIEEENEKKKTTDTRKYIAQDIADNIASFAQLLEPLNAIKENKIRSKSGILFDWEMRIQSLIGDLPIKTYWRNNFRNYEIWTDEKCMEKAGELLSMLELVGIVRDKAKEVVIDKDTLNYYSAQSEHLNNDFHIGETVVVTRPCWRINGQPARKGEIAKKAPFAEFSRKKVSPLETMLRENSCSDGDVNIPVTEDNFCTYDRGIPYVKQAISEGFCKCAVRRMEDGGALAFFYEVIAEGENAHYPPCTLRFEVNIDKNAKVVGRFKSEKV